MTRPTLTLRFPEPANDNEPEGGGLESQEAPARTPSGTLLPLNGVPVAPVRARVFRG